MSFIFPELPSWLLSNSSPSIEYSTHTRSSVLDVPFNTDVTENVLDTPFSQQLQDADLESKLAFANTLASGTSIPTWQNAQSQFSLPSLMNSLPNTGPSTTNTSSIPNSLMYDRPVNTISSMPMLPPERNGFTSVPSFDQAAYPLRTAETLSFDEFGHMRRATARTSANVPSTSSSYSVPSAAMMSGGAFRPHAQQANTMVMDAGISPSTSSVPLTLPNTSSVMSRNGIALPDDYLQVSSPTSSTPTAPVPAMERSGSSSISNSWVSQPAVIPQDSNLYTRAEREEPKPQKARPFVCSRCSRAFARKHDLERHARVHSGDKPYVCRVCKKGFPRSDALRRHIRVERDTHESYFASKTSDVLVMSERDASK